MYRQAYQYKLNLISEPCRGLGPGEITRTTSLVDPLRAQPLVNRPSQVPSFDTYLDTVGT